MIETNLQTIQEKKKKTELVLSNIYNLPAMSGVMMEVSKMLDDSSTNTGSLSKIIGKDQGLATKILSIANSPLYGLPRRVSTIDFAILIIGYQDIKNIVIALSMVESFKNKTDKLLNQNDFWLHSVVTANASKRISEDLGYRIGSEAFIAGLLHDLGIPVLHKYFHASFEQIYKEVDDNTPRFLELELEHCGMTHQGIGKFLGSKWNLPSNLCEAIEFHHTPSESTENKVLTAIVHLADYMTCFYHNDMFNWDRNYDLDKSILETLKFKSEADFEEFVTKYNKLFVEELGTFRVTS